VHRGGIRRRSSGISIRKIRAQSAPFNATRASKLEARSMRYDIKQVRRERQVEHVVHRLGARAVYEMLVDIAERADALDVVDERLSEYADLDPAVLRAAKGDRFCPHLQVVPRDLWSAS
jgi:hypothetical protein